MISLYMLFLIQCLKNTMASDNSPAWLPQNYSKSQPPTKPILIKVDFFIRQVRQVNDVHQFFEMDMAYNLNWVDKRLMNDEDTLEKMILDKDQFMLLWRPDVYIYNMRSNNLLEVFDPYLFAMLNTSTGELDWWAEHKTQVDCNMNYQRSYFCNTVIIL